MMRRVCYSYLVVIILYLVFYEHYIHAKGRPPKEDMLTFTILKPDNCLVEFKEINSTPVIPGENFFIRGSFMVHYPSSDNTPIDDGLVALSVRHEGFQLIDNTILLSELFHQADIKEEIPIFPLCSGKLYKFSIGGKLPDSISPGVYWITIQAYTSDSSYELFQINAKFIKVNNNAKEQKSLHSSSVDLSIEEKSNIIIEEPSNSSGSILSIFELAFPTFLLLLLTGL